MGIRFLKLKHSCRVWFQSSEISHRRKRESFSWFCENTHKPKKNQYSQNIRPKLIWHQKIKTELQGETNKNHSNKFFLLISINHSKNFNAKIYNSSVSVWCLLGYTREPQVKKATFIHKLNFFFFFFVDNLIVGGGGIRNLNVPHWKHQEVSTN